MVDGIGIQRLITDNAVFWINEVKRQQEIMPLPNLVTQALGALQGWIARLGPFSRVHLIPTVQHARLRQSFCLCSKHLTAQPAAHHLLSAPGIVKEAESEVHLIFGVHIRVTTLAMPAMTAHNSVLDRDSGLPEYT